MRLARERRRVAGLQLRHEHFRVRDTRNFAVVARFALRTRGIHARGALHQSRACSAGLKGGGDRIHALAIHSATVNHILHRADGDTQIHSLDQESILRGASGEDGRVLLVGDFCSAHRAVQSEMFISSRSHVQRMAGVANLRLKKLVTCINIRICLFVCLFVVCCFFCFVFFLTYRSAVLMNWQEFLMIEWHATNGTVNFRLLSGMNVSNNGRHD